MPVVKNESQDPEVADSAAAILTRPSPSVDAKRKSEDVAASSPKRLKSSEAPDESKKAKALFRECMSALFFHFCAFRC
jgi:hypothetical protein